MFSGSSACLMVFIALIPAGPNSSSSRFFLPRPIPCSPVTVPLTRRDSLQKRVARGLGATRCHSLSQRLAKRVHMFDFLRTRGIDDDEDVEISITDMANDGTIENDDISSFSR